MPPYVEIVFRELFEELRFMKRQQWTITNYGVLILAAIYAVGQKATFNYFYLKVAAFVIAAVGSYLLLRIQSDMARNRLRSNKLHKTYFNSK